MSDPIFIYCSVCATALIEQSVDRVHRSVCPGCNVIPFLDSKLVAIVVVQHEGKFLLGRRNKQCFSTASQVLWLSAPPESGRAHPACPGCC